MAYGIVNVSGNTNGAIAYKGSLTSESELIAILAANEWEKGWMWGLSITGGSDYVAANFTGIIITQLGHPDTASVEMSTFFTYFACIEFGSVSQAGTAVVSGNIPIFAEETGKTIKDSGVSISDIETEISDAASAAAEAAEEYADTQDGATLSAAQEYADNTASKSKFIKGTASTIAELQTLCANGWDAGDAWLWAGGDSTAIGTLTGVNAGDIIFAKKEMSGTVPDVRDYAATYFRII